MDFGFLFWADCVVGFLICFVLYLSFQPSQFVDLWKFSSAGVDPE